MHTTVILVTHQSAGVLDSCLRQLATLPDISVRVVDNASTDAGRVMASRAGAAVLALDRNLGFAAAANRGARLAQGPLLCFLNPDCRLDLETLAAAREALAKRPRACAVPDFEQNGSLIPGRQPGYSWRKVIADLLESNQRAPELARRFRRHPAHHDLRWHWPLGTCLFLPAALFESAGGFDERYFLYMEDVEFGHQFHRHGGDVIALGTRLHHGSMQGSSLEAGARRRLLNAARVQFARRHYGPLIGWWAGRLARP